MFPGSTVEDEMHLIFKMLGTPTEVEWPQINDHSEFKTLVLPFYEPQPLITQVPRLDLDGLDLLARFLCVGGMKVPLADYKNVLLRCSTMFVKELPPEKR